MLNYIKLKDYIDNNYLDMSTQLMDYVNTDMFVDDVNNANDIEIRGGENPGMQFLGECLIDRHADEILGYQ